MTRIDDDRRAYWLEVWRWAGGDRERVKAVRDAARRLGDRPLGPLLRVELSALGVRSELAEGGRTALAATLDVAWRLAPAAYPGLLDAVVGPAFGPCDLAAAGRLWSAFAPIVKTLSRRLAEVPRPGTGGVAPALAPAEGELRGDRDHLRRQGEALLRYHARTTDLGVMQAGIAAAAAWAGDEAHRTRLARVAGLDAAALFADVATLVGLVALRGRRELAGRGLGWPPPDVAFMETPSVAVPKVVVAPPAAPEPAPARAAPWLDGARVWAARRGKKLEGLLEDVVRRLHEQSILWPHLQEATQRLPDGANTRVQQLARTALASLLDEYLQAYPQHYGDLLEHITVEAHETISYLDTARLWITLEPLLHGWAKTLEPEVDARNGHKVVEVLNRHGNIVPLDGRQPRAAQEREARRVIDAVYVDGVRDAEPAWRAVYWAVTMTRNDQAHANLWSMKGRVAPLDLLRDAVALASLAAVRFKLALARRQGGPPTMPDTRGLGSD